MKSPFNTPSPIEMELGLQFLVGLRIVDVAYVELDYGSGEPLWDSQSPHFDSLDHGINLTLHDGSTVSITWDWDYAQYGISLDRGPLNLKPGPVSWPASARWRQYLNTPIERVRVYWSYWEQRLPHPERTYFPQDLRFDFEGGTWVAASAFEFRADSGTGMPGADNITVFYRDHDLKHFRICSHGPNLRPSEVPWPA